MKALCWYGSGDVRVEAVPDPQILNPHDAIVKITLTAICGSDLHIYNGFIPGMERGDILGHEFMGEIVEVGKQVTNLEVGDRVVVSLVQLVKANQRQDQSQPMRGRIDELIGVRTLARAHVVRCVGAARHDRLANSQAAVSLRANSQRSILVGLGRFDVKFTLGAHPGCYRRADNAADEQHGKARGDLRVCGEFGVELDIELP